MQAAGALSIGTGQPSAFFLPRVPKVLVVTTPAPSEGVLLYPLQSFHCLPLPRNCVDTPEFVNDPECAGTTLSCGVDEETVGGFCPFPRLQGQL